MRAQLTKHPFTVALPAAALLTAGMTVVAPPAQAAPNLDPAVFVNELHYDNDGGDAGEAIELAGPAGTDLAGYELVLYNGNGGAEYDSVSLSQILPDQEDGFGTAVVDDFGSIQNGSPDGIALVHEGEVVQFLSYEGSLTAVGGPADGLTSTDIGVDESGSTDVGHSLQLTGSGTTYADFTWAAPQPGTFGQVNTDQTFGEGTPGDGGGDDGGGDEELMCDATDPTPISQVQGEGFESPLAGQQVTVEGAVTAIYPDLGGITVQEEPGDTDGNAATSEGVFVFLGFGSDTGDLARGDVVQVNGGVNERFENTQITGDYATCDAPAVEIEPTPLNLPADAEERETLEGMLVITSEDLTVNSSFTAYSFNELGVSSSGLLQNPTSVHAPGSPEALELQEANARNLLYIDDRGEFAGYEGSGNAPWFGEAGDRAGDIVEAGVVGTLYYSFDDYLLEPVGDLPEVVDSDAPSSDREPAPELAAGNDVASFNVLNYFNTFGDSAELRGAQSLEQFERQSAKIVDAITSLDAAVVGLIELENDYDTRQSDVGEDQPAIATLVEALNATDSGQTYDWVRVQDLLTEEGFGGLGTDAIAQGIIYQPDRATPTGEPATFDIDALLGGDSENNRWPLAQTFDIDGEEATVVVNHFKSKGSTCSDTVVPEGFGDGQNDPMTGNCDLVREYAAERLLEWIETKPTGTNTPNTLVIGDLNSYEEEDPIEIFVDAGYLDTVQRYGDDAFTYKFDGTFGRLDYILASPSAKRLVVDAEVWQANSAEPYGYLYSNSPIDNTAYASSDHDPVVVSLGGSDEQQQCRAPGKPDRAEPGKPLPICKPVHPGNPGHPGQGHGKPGHPSNPDHPGQGHGKPGKPGNSGHGGPPPWAAARG